MTYYTLLPQPQAFPAFSLENLKKKKRNEKIGEPGNKARNDVGNSTSSQAYRDVPLSMPLILC